MTQSFSKSFSLFFQLCLCEVWRYRTVLFHQRQEPRQLSRLSADLPTQRSRVRRNGFTLQRDSKCYLPIVLIWQKYNILLKRAQNHKPYIHQSIFISFYFIIILFTLFFHNLSFLQAFYLPSLTYLLCFQLALHYLFIVFRS